MEPLLRGALPHLGNSIFSPAYLSRWLRPAATSAIAILWAGASGSGCAEVGQRHSKYNRADHDYYVEPRWCVHGLFSCVQQLLFGEVHDPCAGSGVVVAVALERGFVVSAADIVDRAGGRFPTRDFFDDFDIYSNIICNPPFGRAAELIAKSIDYNLRDNGKVAVLVPTSFLASASRYPLFSRPEFDAVWILSKRPSMPPGQLLAREGEACRHSGSIDFCWAVWQRSRAGVAPQIGWIPPHG